MKTLVIPSSLKSINNLDCDGFILGIKNLSINLPFYCDAKDIKDINKEVFIALNKNIHNSDIPLLKKTLIELANYKIKGIIFYDVAVVNLVKKLGLQFDLVWNQEHMTNNYYTTNFWYDNNVKYTWVSNDITLRECLEIKDNTKSKLMITLFGYIPMFTSRRNLVENYFKTFKMNRKSQINFIEKEKKLYPLIDEKLGTTCYTNFILNGLKEKLLLHYDYIVLNSFLIADADFIKVLSIFNQVNDNNYLELDSKLNSMFPNLSKGFFYEETVYKVK